MSEQGKLVIYRKNNDPYPKIEINGHQTGFKYKQQLSRPLLDDFRTTPESLEGRMIEFSRGERGTIVCVTEVGQSWENPNPPFVQKNDVPVEENHVGQITIVSSYKKDVMVKGKLKKKDFIRFSNNQESSKTNICDIDTSVGKPVEEIKGFWERSDYTSRKPNCYPFNFVAAPRAPKQAYFPVPEVKQDPKTTKEVVSRFFAEHRRLDHGRFDPNAHTGIIEVELTALSPLIISHPPGRDGILSPKEQNAMETVCNDARKNSAYGDTEIDGRPNKPATRDERMQRIRPPYQVGPDQYALPATSLKGMIRSMVEAYSHSLMGALSACLKGDDDEGKAQIRSRTNWRAGKAGLAANQATLYTYEWNMAAKTWQRWVKRTDTPWEKLSHVNPEAKPLHLSLADAMFGRVFKKNEEKNVESAIPALRGRIRISEAVGWDDSKKSTVKVADDYWFLKSLTRPSGAKAKCEALYLRPDKSGEVAKYGDPNSEARGRKMYWPHSLGNATQQDAKPLTWMRDKIIGAKTREELWQDVEFHAAVKAFQERVRGDKASQASTKSWVKPLLPGSAFRFSIRFENLTEFELGALLKAIELENTGGTAAHCHRLGRAKPLGFGSVALSVKAIKLWDAPKAAANLKPADDFWLTDAQKDAATATARKSFEDFCTNWKAPVWDDIAALTEIPTRLTDLDYWKNWTDYQPWKNKDCPLPLPRKAKP